MMNLHMKLWNEDAMSEVASMVGVPLSTDKVTQDRSNNFYARVLIEVNVSKPPPLSFPIRLPSRKVVNQSVVYETFPNFCFHCKEYGHHPFICKKLATQEREKAREEKEEKTWIEGMGAELKDKEKLQVKKVEIQQSTLEKEVRADDVEAEEEEDGSESDTMQDCASQEMGQISSLNMNTSSPKDSENEESDSRRIGLSADDCKIFEECKKKIMEPRMKMEEARDKEPAQKGLG
ncbi:unnamed protein product [Cuscuta europaea]|uniref:DUF4283 domain-containing protein n=1 Tax=Cuscuta europaea TaxID=41803 RepID=A0A9P0ZZ44_CUSEU|nr:unnamed protein product [Cuscuta europaea]